MTGLLAGRVALVTGAASGIGAAIAAAYAAADARVVVVDIDLAGASKVAGDIGAGAIAVATDCGDVAQIDELVARVIAEAGGIDILVNNAGLTFQTDILTLDEDGWDRVNRINGKGLFFCMQRVARHMVERGRGGRIINIGSISGRGFTASANAAYAFSKGGVIALTQVASFHLARHDINVNAICPGPTESGLLGQVMHQRATAAGMPIGQVRDGIAATIPLGRLNDPGDVADLALFLAGPGSRNITGQSINVDGGIICS